jgi:hypothetical protein
VKRRSTKIWCERSTSFWEEKFRMQWIGCSQYRNNIRHPKVREVEKEMAALEHHNMPGASVLEIFV